MSLTQILPTGVAGVSGTKASGLFTALTAAVEGSTITLINAEGISKTYEVDSDGIVAAGNTPILVAAGALAGAVASAAALVISDDTNQFISAVVAGADVTVTQLRPGVAGDTAIVVTGAGPAFSKTDFAGGVDPTGDHAIAQVAARAMSPGDILQYMDENAGASPTSWNIGSTSLEDDFLVKTSRNGIEVASQRNKSSTFGPQGAFARFNIFVVKNGRNMDCSVRGTYKGNGVDGSLVPKSKWTSSSPFPLSTFETDLEAFFLTPGTGSRNGAILRFVQEPLSVAHSNWIFSNDFCSLEDIELTSFEGTVIFAHPGDQKGVHYKETGLIPTAYEMDPRSVYPNFKSINGSPKGNQSFGNPLKSLVDNGKWTKCIGGSILLASASEVTVSNSTMTDMHWSNGNGILGTLLSDVNDANFRLWRDRTTGLSRNCKIIGCTADSLTPDGGGLGAFITSGDGVGMFAGCQGAGGVIDGFEISGNDLLEMKQNVNYTTRDTNAVDIFAAPGASITDGKIEGNTWREVMTGISLFASGIVEDIRIDNNIWNNYRSTGSQRNAFRNAEVLLRKDSGGFMNKIFITGNDYLLSGTPGLATDPAGGMATMIGPGVSFCQVNDKGGYPSVAGGAVSTNFVVDLGFKNNVVGEPSNLTGPGGGLSLEDGREFMAELRAALRM